MDSPSSLSSSSHILVFLFFLLSLPLFSFSSSSEQTTTFKDIGPGNPGLNLVPSPLSGSKVISCERVRVSAVSRLKIASYANSFKITLTPSITVPERLRTKIEVCFHRNASLGLCQCGKDEWKAIQKGNWSSFTSPYEERYFDIKFADETTGSLSVSLEEEFQPWRFYCLAFGFVLLLFAPIVSNWVPFYYSSSMVIGVLLVVLILLFQNPHCDMCSWVVLRPVFVGDSPIYVLGFLRDLCSRGGFDLSVGVLISQSFTGVGSKVEPCWSVW